ncbi:MAG: NifU family protein [Myxococcota bacterium]
MHDRVQQVLDEIIRPLVEADGGTIELRSATPEEVVVHLSAACAGCPGAHYTRTHVVEPALRRVVLPTTRIEVHTVAKPG